jgi:hypothetical protein
MCFVKGGRLREGPALWELSFDAVTLLLTEI